MPEDAPQNSVPSWIIARCCLLMSRGRAHCSMGDRTSLLAEGGPGSAPAGVLARQFDEMKTTTCVSLKVNVEQVVESGSWCHAEQFHGKPVRLPSETVKDWEDEPLVLIAASKARGHAPFQA